MARGWSVLLAALVAAGCASKTTPRPAAGPPTAAARASAVPAAPASTAAVAPGGPLVGRVASVNPNGRFVVISFPIGALPAADRPLSVYRAGLKVGELKVTRWQLDNLVVADIVAGECRPGDEAREE